MCLSCLIIYTTTRKTHEKSKTTVYPSTWSVRVKTGNKRVITHTEGRTSLWRVSWPRWKAKVFLAVLRGLAGRRLSQEDNRLNAGVTAHISNRLSWKAFTGPRLWISLLRLSFFRTLFHLLRNRKSELNFMRGSGSKVESRPLDF